MSAIVWAYSHPEVDRVYGLVKGYMQVYSKMMFYLLKDGCVYIYIHTCIHISYIYTYAHDYVYLDIYIYIDT